MFSNAALLERTLLTHSVEHRREPQVQVQWSLSTVHVQGRKHCLRQSVLNDDKGARDGGEANPERPLGNLFVGDAAGCASRWGI